MAKAQNWNSNVERGVELAGSLDNGVKSVGTTAVALDADGVECVWVIVQNFSESAAIYIGGSSLTNSGATRGLRVRPNGTSDPIRVYNLDAIFVVAETGTVDVAYLVGKPS